jgi:hypothetical protein
LVEKLRKTIAWDSRFCALDNKIIENKYKNAVNIQRMGIKIRGLGVRSGIRIITLEKKIGISRFEKKKSKSNYPTSKK